MDRGVITFMYPKTFEENLDGIIPIKICFDTVRIRASYYSGYNVVMVGYKAVRCANLDTLKEILLEHFKYYKIDYDGQIEREYWYCLSLDDIDICIENLSLDELDMNADEME